MPHGSQPSQPYILLQVEPITEDDYFAKNPEFSTWLRERKKKYFNELTSESARELFSGFIQLWNDRKLPAKYYQGMQGVTMRRTQHAWSVPGPSIVLISRS